MKLDRAILEVLDAAEHGAPGHSMFPAEKIFRDSFLFVVPDPTRGEFDKALSELERKKQVYLDWHEDKGRIVKLTAPGRARIRE